MSSTPDLLSTSVTLMVDELEASVRFYQQKLGFSIEYDAGPHFAMVRRSGLRLGLHPRGSGASAGDCRGVSIGLEVADIRASVAALEAGGVPFPDGVVEDGPLLRADFSDPDGTALYLVQLTDRQR
jgi:catechol 2,3-dioxygenase-like lactoylglutathione lyase family enzyme